MNLTTDDADGKIRLDQYLAAHLPELSRSRIQSLIKSGDVLVNGSPAKPKNPVSRGDSITVRIPEPEPAEAQPQDIPLDILYEDVYVVVINKESGMVVHPAAGNPDGTIVNALLHHCGDLSGIGGVNTGCSGAHGFGDYLSSLPGGHDYMHGERVMVGLVIQLILEGYQEQEIRRVIRFGRKVGLPVSVAELFEEPIEELAHRIGQDTYNDHFVCHMNCDHSAQAIEGAVRMAVALAKEMEQEELHLER